MRAIINSAEYAPPCGAIGSALSEILVRERYGGGVDLRDESLRWLRDSVPGLPTDAIDDFRQVASDTAKVTGLVADCGVVRMLADTTLARFFPRHSHVDGWVVFWAAHPHARGGIISLSRVGLNRHRTWAVTYVDHQAGWLSGAGYLVVLHRDGDVWHQRGSLMLRIS